MYVELVEGDIKNRGRIVPIGTVGLSPRDQVGYISLFPFDKNIIDYVNTHKTIKGYTGQHACTYICIDIDNKENVEEARINALRVIERLNSRYGISPDDLYIYYSGNKGFHIYLCDRLLGIQNQFYNGIGEKCKQFIGESLAGIGDVDMAIFEDHRLIRIPNSRHGESGRYKIELSYEEVKDSLASIITLAQQPRNAKRKKLYSDIQSNEKLHEDFMSFFDGVQVVDKSRKDVTGFWKPMPEGDRNGGYYKQACALFAHSVLSEQSILEILSSINEGSEKPLPREELKLVVRSASKAKAPTQAQEARLYTFRDAVPLWLDSIKPEKNKITLFFQNFNDEMRGKLRGKVCDIIGYGGSKKSLYAQFVAHINVMMGQRVLYSSMEMGIPDLMEREINMTIEPDQYSAAYELEEMDTRDHNKVLWYLDEKAAPVLGDRMLMTDGSAMTCEKYDKMLEGINTRTGIVDILVVDGLGMMGGKGTDTERINEATKELKELAKKWNIFVLLICHVRRGEDRANKDLSQALRDSEKILDNCDFYISMAQHKMIDESGTVTYNNKWGNARLGNKRGSGRSIDASFELDERKLSFIQLWNPADIPTVKETVSFNDF